VSRVGDSYLFGVYWIRSTGSEIALMKGDLPQRISGRRMIDARNGIMIEHAMA
jgi:hypothetical protein